VSAARIWLLAARPRTLPTGAAPVLVGTALAHHDFHVLRFVAALVGALFIQVGANLSNDYSDARRGADTEDRLGPVRVTAGGLVPPRQVLVATYVAFGVAVLAGVYLIAVAGVEILLVGIASILAGVLYTGGPRPYGYEGLGEVFVFLFFGVAAVAGSYFAQTEHWAWQAFALSASVGLLAAAVLVVNNVRDMDTDRRAGKRTLAVRLGRDRTRVLYAAMLAVAYLAVLSVVGSLTAGVLLPWLTAPLALRLVAIVREHSDGPTLNAALARTAMLELAFCVLLSAGILLS
jgi:1,4-dihydroxy-2-naphthoate octaprenyltransferase